VEFSLSAAPPLLDEARCDGTPDARGP